jgi:hypothetical protein
MPRDHFQDLLNKATGIAFQFFNNIILQVELPYILSSSIAPLTLYHSFWNGGSSKCKSLNCLYYVKFDFIFYQLLLFSQQELEETSEYTQ